MGTGLQKDEAFNSFREATWCDCLRSCYKQRTNYVDWHKVQDVDVEESCCFGHLDLQTWDADLGDVKLRVRRGNTEKISSQIFNKSLGRDKDEVDQVRKEFR